eukprot:m51a1_g3818 putative guanine nucleotide-binding protein g subunit alpha-3 (359) ;mRNA; r:275995-277471
MGNLCSGSPDKSARKVNQQIERELDETKKTLSSEITLLLLGCGESGKSTLAKQMKILHRNGYTQEEVLRFKGVIFHNTVMAMRTLCEACAELQIPVDAPNKERHEWFLQSSDIQFFEGDLTPRIVDDIKALWGDSGIQAAYLRSAEFQLPDSARYYFEAIDRMASPRYIPTDQDVLHTRIKTTGINEIKFFIGETPFKMLDVGGQRSERGKWINCFQGVTCVLFCASLSEYDQKLYEDNISNRMHESLRIWTEICNTKWFTNTPMILFLNKKDLFAEKITRVPLNVCFPHFDGMPGSYDSAVQYIRDVYLARNKNPNKQICVHVTCATDTELVRKLFQDVKEIVLRFLIDHQSSGQGV